MQTRLDSTLLLISVGNTRTRFAVAREGRFGRSISVTNAEGSLEDLVQHVRTELASDGFDDAVPLIASVNDRFAGPLERALDGVTVESAYRFNREVPIPLDHTLSDASTLGVDRALNALGAFWKTKQASVVIDVGTAATVDFIDGRGVFHGGAIAPGLDMMCAALHDHTAALPRVAPARGESPLRRDPPFGHNTESAIQLGAAAAVVGLARVLIDAYAEFYGGYPTIIATGGDAPLLFNDDTLVEHVVPDLTLIGMIAALEKLEAQGAEPDSTGDHSDSSADRA